MCKRLKQRLDSAWNLGDVVFMPLETAHPWSLGSGKLGTPWASIQCAKSGETHSHPGPLASGPRAQAGNGDGWRHLTSSLSPRASTHMGDTRV